MDQHGRPEVILIGFCNSALPELQILKAEISKSCSVLVMDIGRWQASLAAEVDVAPSEWLLKESGGELSTSQLAELSEEAHYDMVATNAVGWLQAMLSKFDGVIALGGNVLGTAACSRILRDALPVDFPKLLIPVQARDGGAQHADKTDMAIMYGGSTVAGINSASESLLRRAAAAIAAMAAVERATNSDKKTAACELATAL